MKPLREALVDWFFMDAFPGAKAEDRSTVHSYQTNQFYSKADRFISEMGGYLREPSIQGKKSSEG